MGNENPFETPIDFHVTPDDWLDVEQLMAMFHENNPQVRSQLEIEAIQYSIQVDGFTAEMIIVNPWNGKIVSGHGRVWACHQAGYRGKLPVVYKEYKGEEAHRLAMLRWNRARGHQDPELEKAEVQALLEAYDRAILAQVSAVVTVNTQFAAMMLNEFPPIEGRESTRNTGNNEESPDEWPRLAVQVSTETMGIYKALLAVAKGENEGERTAAILQAVNAANFPYLQEVSEDDADDDGLYSLADEFDEASE